MIQIKKFIDKKISAIIKLIISNIIEILLIVGAFFIIYASFMIAEVLGLYVLGLSLVGFSILLLRYPEGR